MCCGTSDDRARDRWILRGGPSGGWLAALATCAGCEAASGSKRRAYSTGLRGCSLGWSIEVTLVHRMARLGDAVDGRPRFRVCYHEALEVGLSEHQQPAIGQRRYVRLTRPARKQRHLSE